MTLTKIKKLLLSIAGLLSFGLGVLGIFLPILPTTPFLLLSSYCFYISSERLHKWLNNHKIFGPYIYNYMKYRAVRRRVKVGAITMLWVTLSISIFLVDIIYVRLILLAIGTAVTVHILMLKTLENVLENIKEDDKENINK